jgi:hypothetical protein
MREKGARFDVSPMEWIGDAGVEAATRSPKESGFGRDFGEHLVADMAGDRGYSYVASDLRRRG